jgi:hypothetical protein
MPRAIVSRVEHRTAGFLALGLFCMLPSFRFQMEMLVRHVFIAAAMWLVSASLQAATVGGLNVHSTTTGTGETTIILVHGYTCDESTWSEQVPA